MTDKNLDLLQDMYNATVKCFTVANAFKNVNELTENKLIYDIVISNLNLIYELFNKVELKFKLEYSFVDWYKFDKYRNQVQSDFHALDSEGIWEIITNQLPNLKDKLEIILIKNK